MALTVRIAVDILAVVKVQFCIMKGLRYSLGKAVYSLR